MPEGACCIRYEGKRGDVWYVKFRDASGRQVKQRLGTAAQGWNRRKAQSELRARLVAVEMEGYQRPEPVTFGSLAREWLDSYPAAKGLKRSTTKGYTAIVEKHLVPAFGTFKPNEVTVECIERYLATRRREGLSAGSLNRQLNV